jgi:hypothetical protein
MRKEARLFKNKAVDALVLAIETFNWASPEIVEGC